MEMDKCPLFNGNESSEVIRPLINLFQLFKTRAPDQAEIACLKALVLFRSGKIVTDYCSNYAVLYKKLL